MTFNQSQCFSFILFDQEFLNQSIDEDKDTSGASRFN